MTCLRPDSRRARRGSNASIVTLVALRLRLDGRRGRSQPGNRKNADPDLAIQLCSEVAMVDLGRQAHESNGRTQFLDAALRSHTPEVPARAITSMIAITHLDGNGAGFYRACSRVRSLHDQGLRPGRAPGSSCVRPQVKFSSASRRPHQDLTVNRAGTTIKLSLPANNARPGSKWGPRLDRSGRSGTDCNSSWVEDMPSARRTGRYAEAELGGLLRV